MAPFRSWFTRHLGAPASAEPAGQAGDWLQGNGDLLIAGMGGQVPVAVQLGVLAHADLNRLADLGRGRRLGSVRRANVPTGLCERFTGHGWHDSLAGELRICNLFSRLPTFFRPAAPARSTPPLEGLKDEYVFLEGPVCRLLRRCGVRCLRR